MKKEIKVTVAGVTASGKSSIALSLIKCLKEHGIEVELISEDYNNSIEHMEHSLEHDITLEKRLFYLQEKVKVIVEEKNCIK